MLITDDEILELKTWVINKLENISDADSEVLADYVLALIRNDGSLAELRSSAIENLDDFLKNHTHGFVDELLQTIKLKSYLPGYGTSVPSVNSHKASQPLTAATKHLKRTYNDSQQGLEPRESRSQHVEEDAKHARKINVRRDEGHGLYNGSKTSPVGFFRPSLAPASLSTQRPDPVGAMMAFPGIGFPIPHLQGNGTFQFMAPDSAVERAHLSKSKINARCKDYDTKGICHRGINCPFLHDANQIILPPPDGYGPPTTMLNALHPRRQNRGHASPGAIPGHDAKTVASRRTRAAFSMTGPNHNRSNTTIVVEQIPDENFEKDQVSQFFSTFGKIDEITMHAAQRLAVVKYEGYAAAKAAYESPKVIFDNRFVKVYWHHPGVAQAQLHGRAKAGSPPSSSRSQEPGFDRQKFERDSEAAQKRLEERKALKANTDAKLTELAKQKDVLDKQYAEAKEKLADILRTKGKLPASSDKDKAATEALRAQLRALEEEAKNLGLEPEPWSSRVRGRGRGSYHRHDSSRGRGASEVDRGVSRGRGSYRGGFAGRGRRAGFDPGAFNLDNRPKKLLVQGVVFDEPKSEALRQHLTTIGDFLSVSPGGANAETDPPDALTVVFKNRAVAERLFYGARDIPGVGRLDISWVRDPLPLATIAQDNDIPKANGAEGDTPMTGDDEERAAESNGSAEDGIISGEDPGSPRAVDYDVAEDDDRWG